MFQITIAAGAIKSVGVLPVDDNENNGTYDNATPVTFVSTGPVVLTPGAPLAGFAAHPLIQPRSDAAPGTYNVDAIFKPTAGGPSVTTTFQVIVPPSVATHLKFVEL